MNLLKKTIVFLSFFLLFSPYVNASASVQSEGAQTNLSDTKSFTKTVSYDRKYYSMNIYESGKIIPNYLWVSSGSYSGNLPLTSWYISKTHYVVTYSGQLRRGPYAPASITREFDNLEGGTSNE